MLKFKQKRDKDKDEKDIIISKLQHPIWSDFYIIVYILDFLDNGYGYPILKLRLINKFFANDEMGKEMMRRVSLDSPWSNSEIIPNLKKKNMFLIKNLQYVQKIRLYSKGPNNINDIKYLREFGVLENKIIFCDIFTDSDCWCSGDSVCMCCIHYLPVSDTNYCCNSF